MADSPSSFPNFWSWEFFGFWIIPAAAMFIAILLNVTYITGFPGVSIHWLILVIFYWATYRPEWQPTLLVFIASLIYDFISGNPLLGVTPFLGVSAHLILRRQTHLLRAIPFWGVWLVTAGMVFIWRTLEAALNGVLLGQWPSLGAWLGSTFITALAFPIVAMCMAPLNRISRN